MQERICPLYDNSPPTSDLTLPPASPNTDTDASFKDPIFEDLTKDNYNLLQTLLRDESTRPVWTVSGYIRLKLARETVV